MGSRSRLAAGHRPDALYYLRDWRPDAPPPAVTNLRSAGMQPYAVEGMVALSIIVSAVIAAVTLGVIAALSWFDGREK